MSRSTIPRGWRDGELKDLVFFSEVSTLLKHSNVQGHIP